MFALGSDKDFEWPVTLRVAADGGKFTEFTFSLKFKRLTQTRIKALMIDGQTGKATDADVVREIVVGWREVVDADSNELPFN